MRVGPAGVAGGADTGVVPGERRRRRYRRTERSKGPRTYRTRKDPFEAVWDEVCTWLAARPERTAKSVLRDLQHRYPGQYPDGQLRTMQSRVKAWRARILLTFDEQWLNEEVLAGQILPLPLRTLVEPLPVGGAAPAGASSLAPLGSSAALRPVG